MMNINIAITCIGLLASILQALSLFLLGHIFKKIDSIDHVINEHVNKDYCYMEMRKIYEEQQMIWKEIRKNADDIAKLGMTSDIFMKTFEVQK